MYVGRYGCSACFIISGGLEAVLTMVIKWTCVDHFGVYLVRAHEQNNDI